MARKNLGDFEMVLPGKHNVLNAAAAVAMAHQFNAEMEKVREALANFEGTSRRFEYIGKRNGAILIDDYGHHPEEIKATLQAAREFFPKRRIWCVFHPHTFTRTKALLSEFAQSFEDADRVIVLRYLRQRPRSPGRSAFERFGGAREKISPQRRIYSDHSRSR